jgi:cullin-associated NEDD8-dissociated protein 1
MEMKIILQLSSNSVALLGSFFQANRALRQATLGTLNSIVVTYGDQIGSSSYEAIIAELSTLIRSFTKLLFSF